jgi:hypothetical protein
MRVTEELYFGGTMFCVEWAMCILNLLTDIEAAIEWEFASEIV